MVRVISVLAFALLLGCQTTAEVSIDVLEDGSGEVAVGVVLDPQAAMEIDGAEALELGDLDGTGWEVTGPDTAADGTVSISGVHQFAGEEELAAVLDMVAGPGVFTNVSIDISESFGNTSWAAGMDVSATGDPTQFSDDALTEVLSGLPLGRTADELAALGATAPGAATLSVTLSLFGEDIDSAQLDLTSGQPSSESLTVEHSRSQPLALGLAAGAVAGLLAAVVLGVVAVVRRRRRR